MEISTLSASKQCSRCKNVFEITNFPIKKNQKDGHNTICKNCERERKKGNVVYSGLNLAELKNLMKENNIKSCTPLNKGEIVSLLKEKGILGSDYQDGIMRRGATGVVPAELARRRTGGGAGLTGGGAKSQNKTPRTAGRKVELTEIGGEVKIFPSSYAAANYLKTCAANVSYNNERQFEINGKTYYIKIN